MRICVFTGTRAEYGLLKPVLERIQADPELELNLLVSGSHLSKRHGYTIDAIVADGFTPTVSVPMELDDDTAAGMAEAMGRALPEYTRAIESMAPDMVLILGDRYEAFICTTAAAIAKVPVAHIHGGETTEGAIDEFFRHSMTKMAHLHFASCETYRQRIIQLGEHPDRVFNVGALGVENIHTIARLSKAELEADLGFTLGDTCLLVTYHPVTLENDGTAQARSFFRGLEYTLDNNDDITILLTGANADPGGSTIDALAADLEARYPGRVLTIASLGLVRYLSAMEHAAAVVGNSSSGILEAPSLRVPTVNAGNRQQGREQAASVFNCTDDADDLRAAIERALSPEGRDIVKNARNPYEKEGTSRRIIQEMKQAKPGMKKTFHDIPFSSPRDGNKE